MLLVYNSLRLAAWTGLESLQGNKMHEHHLGCGLVIDLQVPKATPCLCWLTKGVTETQTRFSAPPLLCMKPACAVTLVVACASALVPLQIDPSKPEADAKADLIREISDFINVRIHMADHMIVQHAAAKVCDWGGGGHVGADGGQD